MVKKVFLAAAATLALAAFTMPVTSTQALACHGCWKASKKAGLATFKERKEYRKACRAHYKALKKAA